MTTTVTLRLCATLMAFWVFSVHAVAQEAMPLLKTKTEDYANVTLISQTPTHVFVKHSRGMATIKRSNIEAAALLALCSDGSNVISATVSDSNSAEASAQPEGTLIGLKQSPAEMFAALSTKWSPVAISGKVVIAVLGGMFALYLFVCYCAKLICQKAGSEPGLLVWLPILQLFPLLRAAGLSGWWFIGFCLPVVSILAHILWCIRICQARGKGGVAMFFLIFPVTYPLAFLYLAFSGSAKSEEQPVVLASQRDTEPLPA